MTLHNILDALVRLSITSIPGLQSLVPRPGQRRVTSQQDDRYIILTQFYSQRQLLDNGVNAQTIRNRLRKNNIPIRARRPYTGPILTTSLWAARLFWAQRHLHWTRRQWHNVIFNAESRFSVSHVDGRVRVYRRRNEIYAQCCVRNGIDSGRECYGMGRYHGQSQGRSCGYTG